MLQFETRPKVTGQYVRKQSIVFWYQQADTKNI